MIRALRKKFVLVSMSLVLVVLLAVFTALCAATASNQRQAAERSLDTLLQQYDASPSFEIRKPSGRNESAPKAGRDLVVGFVVTLDADGTVSDLATSSATVSDETAAELVALAQGTGADSGMIRAYSLRYRISNEGGVTRIAFLDVSLDMSAMSKLMITSLLVGVLALLAFFLISLFLSNLALKPVEAAWNRQKQFIADASHELKTPLTVILANQKILLLHPEQTVEAQRRWIENTQSEGNRMRTLIEDLLFLAKSGAGKDREAFGEVSFSDAAQSTLLSFASLVFEAGITLEDDIQPDVQLVGSEPQLRRLCGILLDNAVKYVDAKGTVRMTLLADGATARLSVYNSGAPIPASEMPHLFERFYRADRARSAGGYGLGLSIAESIVQSHGGRIDVHSTTQAGTTFAVLLPLKSGLCRKDRKEHA